MAHDTTFGILINPLSVDHDYLRIEPVSEFPDVAQWFESRLHPDGFYYPPREETRKYKSLRPGEEGVVVPSSERCAFLFFLEPSHSLSVKSPASERPHDDASFIVQLIAYLHDTRLQLTGEQFDARIPVKWRTTDANVLPNNTARFLERGYHEWRQESPEKRSRLTNILYMHAKAPTYEWPWEQFLIQYMVTDAIYAYCLKTSLATKRDHAERISELCRVLGVWCPDTAPVEALVDMRNELFHEAMWERERPGYAQSSDTYDRVSDLRNLNHRLIAGILGVALSYRKGAWSGTRMMQLFE